MLEADFWQDKSRSKKILKEKKLFEDLTNTYKNSEKNLADFKELYKLAIDESNNDLLIELTDNLKQLKKDIKKTEIKFFLSNEADSLDCYIEIHAGAGGTESQDWASMLRKMYLKWAENKKFKYDLISEHKGEEAGIKSSTIKVEGDYTFVSGSSRKPRFASFWVYHVVEVNIKVEIFDKVL